MTTYTLPLPLSTALGPEIASYIENYVPTTLPMPDWQQVQPAVCEMAARTEPTSPTDARTVLSALCRFLAWAHPLTGSMTLPEVLTGPMVERFTSDLGDEITEGGRHTHRGRLRRCLRVLAGEPARTKRGPRPAGAEPYDAGGMATLVEASKVNDRLARALDLNAHRPRTACVEPAAIRAADLGQADWDAARRAAARAGVTLRQDRLRATWLHELLQRPEPLATLVRREHLTRRDLENAMHHLPVPAGHEERELLRG